MLREITWYSLSLSIHSLLCMDIDDCEWARRSFFGESFYWNKYFSAVPVMGINITTFGEGCRLLKIWALVARFLEKFNALNFCRPNVYPSETLKVYT